MKKELENVKKELQQEKQSEIGRNELLPKDAEELLNLDAIEGGTGSSDSGCSSCSLACQSSGML